VRESRDAVKKHGDADRQAEDCVCEDGVGAFHRILCMGNSSARCRRSMGKVEARLKDGG
jgi:hypothetical protein